MAVLEKLVRDKVPEFFASKGEPCEIRIAHPTEIVGLLSDKLREEVDELAEALRSPNKEHVLEEMADVAAVLLELERRLAIAPGIVEMKQATKAFDRGGFVEGVVLQLKPPVPMILVCPECRGVHVDRGVWATIRIHRSHLCESCGHIWKPFDYATVGVEKLP